MKYFLSIIAITFSFCAAAKNDSASVKKEFSNSVIFSGTDYYFPGEFRRFGTLFFWKDDQLGIYYERKIYKKIRIKLGFSEWNVFPWYGEKLTHKFIVMVHNDSLKTGETQLLGEYKMMDLCISGQLYNHKKHRIHIGIGASYTWGLNDVIDSITVYPGYFDALLFSHGEKKYCYGVVPSIGYDYLCLRNRISIGADVRYRKYFGLYLNTFEYGFHTGFNF